MTNKKNKNNPVGLKEFKILSDRSPFIVREAYSAIRTNLLYSVHSDNCAVFVVCGSSENAGKTLTCINIAVSFARLGKKVLIIDADMRHPSVNKALRIKKSIGLSEVLAKLTKDIPILSTEVENLCVVPAGSIPPNPAELICSSRFEKVLAACSEKFDYIFIDTPPLGFVSDAALLAKNVDGYIFVVRSGVDDKREVSDSLNSVTRVGGKIVGFVLNDVNKKNAGYRDGYGKYGKYSKYYYGQKYSAADNYYGSYTKDKDEKVIDFDEEDKNK